MTKQPTLDRPFGDPVPKPAPSNYDHVLRNNYFAPDEPKRTRKPFIAKAPAIINQQSRSRP